ncbi:MAG: hypothetical protein P4L64_13200 [Caulobacteraceae bacterium]|nr:hypothetical protein [Caulobacteraceae bacterium]
MSIPAVIFWILAIFALFSPPVVAVYLFLGTAAFGALAVVPPDMVGGTNILPQATAALILAARVFADRRSRIFMFNAAKDLRGFGLEALFVVFAIIAAIALPRIFAGRVFTVSMRSALETAQALQPTASNLAQATYLLINLIAGLSLFAFLADDEGGRRREQVLTAVLTSGVILALSGILDSASVFSPALKDFVTAFKNANYELFFETSVLHVHRITGFFPEASAFGAAAVGLGGLIYFIRPAFRSDLARTVLCPLTSLTLIALAAFSTSSTAYLGLGVFAIAVLARLIYRIVKTGTVRGMELDAALGFVLAAMFVGILVFAPDFTRAPLSILDKMVLQKTQSGSFSQRSFWNRVAMQAFFDTYGLGVGPGGARTSNWLVAILSNTGVLGFVLMGGFVVVSYLHRAIEGSRRSAALMTGAKYGFIVFLATEVAAGTTIDPGLLLATIMALMIGSSARVARYAPARPVVRRRVVRREAPAEAGVRPAA